MGKILESLILYLVLFFPSALPITMPAQTAAVSVESEIPPDGGAAVEVIPFSIPSELQTIFIFITPSLALIWYLLCKEKPLAEWIKKPGKKDDFISFGITLPALLLTALALLPVANLTETAAPKLASPHNAAGWIILDLSCFGTGYLEETYFRFYLLNRFEAIAGITVKVLVSAMLFAVCHMYEGPIGFLNAALAGVVLAFVYLKFRSLHGIAWAHGAYNLLVFVLAQA